MPVMLLALLHGQAIPAFLSSYGTVLLVGAAALAMAGGTLLLGRLVRPHNPRVEKGLAYESGAEPGGDGWSQSHVRYYLYALLFVIFEIEVAFIAPWAVQVEDLGVFGLVEMTIFIAVLSLGLLYAWRKKVLSWDS